MRKLENPELQGKLAKVLSEKKQTLDDLPTMALQDLRQVFRTSDKRRRGSANYLMKKQGQADGCEALYSSDRASANAQSRRGKKRNTSGANLCHRANK